MISFIPFLADLMTETDRRALIIVIILLLLIFLIFGLIGMGIRAILLRQAKTADTLMYDATVSHVIQTPSAYRMLGRKKNIRLFFQQSFIPFMVVLVGVLTWIIYASITNTFGNNIFEEFSDLLFLWDFDNPENYTVVFGMTVLAKWPNLIPGHPCFKIEHLASYIEVPLIVGGSLVYLFFAQGFLVRAFTIEKRSHEIFQKSLKGMKVNEIDPKNIPYPGVNPTQNESTDE